MEQQVSRRLLYDFSVTILRPVGLQLLGLAAISLILAVDQSLRPYLIKLLLDNMAGAPATPAIVAQLTRLAILYLVVSALVIGAFRLYELIALRIIPSLRQRIAEQLAAHLLQHSYRFYQEQFSGGLGSRFDDVVDGIPELVELCIERFVRNTFTVLIAILTMQSVDRGFGIAASLWVLLFVIGGLLMSGRQRELAYRASRARALVSGTIVDLCANMMLVQLFATRTHEIGRLRSFLASWVASEQRRAWSALFLYIFQGLSFIIFEAVSIWLLLRGFEQGTLTSGDFALVLSLNVTLVYTLWRIAQDIARFSRLLGVVAQGLRTLLVPRLLQISASAPHEEDALKEQPSFHVSEGAIIFDHVSFRHSGDDDALFADVSITIPAGQKVGLVGYSGSGKSSFVNLILRFFEVTAGTITIDGQNIAEVTPESVRAAVAFIPQNPSLLHRSLWENIRYGALAADDAAVIEASQRAYAHEFINRLPERYDTVVGERGVKLSGGQRQRIAIARAFIRRAAILILDEATSSLDSVTERAVQQSVHELMKGRTTLVIAHRLQTLLEMDRILVFDKGVIVEDGTHHELVEREGLYATLWRAQVCGLLPEQCDIVDVV